MKTEKRCLNLSRPKFGLDEISAIADVLESGWVASGPKCEELEQIVSKYVGVKHAIAVNNCTSAIHLALLGIGTKPGDEIIVSDYAFPATSYPVIYCGAKPIFIDVDKRTYNMNVDKLESKITNKTKAILVTHTFGQPADMKKIVEIAKKRGLFVIEDASAALGAMYKERYAGTIGDIGCYSFDARKSITTGEGGMIVSNNERLATRMRKLSTLGIDSAWERENSVNPMIPQFNDLGYNYKMSDILAAIGIVQMGRLSNIIRKRQKLAECWNDCLDNMYFIEKPYVSKDVTHAYQRYVATLDVGVDRDKLIIALREKGIQTQIGSFSSSVQGVYSNLANDITDLCPASIHLSSRSIALPMYDTLTIDEIQWAANIIDETIGDLN